MPLTPPPIDGRRYEDLVRETLARVPVHTPEWTNLGDADPGVTLVQLFAFMTESLLYRADQIPDRNRLKFLDLLGVGVLPGQAARGLVTVRNEAPGAPQTVNLAEGFELRAGEVPFRAERGLDVLPVEALACFKRRLADQSTELVDYYKLLYASWGGEAGAGDLKPDLYETVVLDGVQVAEVDLSADTVDGALWIALLARTGDKPTPPHTWNDVLPVVRKAIEHKTLSLGFSPSRRMTSRTLPPVGVGGPDAQPPISFQLPAPPAGGKLSDDPSQRVASYRPLEARLLANVLVSPGVVELTLPAADALGLWTDLDPLELGADAFPPALPDEAQQARVVTWIKVTPSVAAQPRFAWAGANATAVAQRVQVRGERLDPGDGTPGQTRTLSRRPVVPGSASIEVSSLGNASTWGAIDDLYGAPPETGAPQGWVGSKTADVFALDPESGLVRFGDGLHGRRPPAGAELRATYDYSQGAAGNVPRGAIKAGPNLPTGFKAENPVATWVFANNPSTAALAALIGSRITESIPLSRVYLLSVGTGFMAHSYPPPDARFPYGVLGWLRPRQDDGAPAFPLVSTVFDGTNQINDFTSRLLLGTDNYIRVNPQLDQTFSMDDCSAIPGMLAETERFMATDEWRLQSARINELFGKSG